MDKNCSPATASAVVESCSACGGPLSAKRIIFDGRTYHEGCLRPHRSAATATPSDFEQVFRDACDEAGCEYDNEALLQAIANLTSYPDMLWEWFTERRGSEDMRSNASQGGLTAEDFKQMLDEHEANIMPDPAQASAECIAELQYEAGMYKSLYEHAAETIAKMAETFSDQGRDGHQIAKAVRASVASSTERQPPNSICKFCARRVFEPCQSVNQAQNACTLASPHRGSAE